jgi:hypothetical protein
VSGAFRGWLCHKCNTGLGKLGDDIADIRRSIAYMTRWLARVAESNLAQRARSRSPQCGFLSP